MTTHKNTLRLLILLFIFALCLAESRQARAQTGTPGAHRFGLGLVLGAPTAITGQYWNTDLTAIDFGLSYASNYYVLIYGDYLWHYPGFFGHSTSFANQVLPYIGVGGGVYSWAPGYAYVNRPYGWNYYDSGVGIYARVPFGVEWYPGQPSLGVFVELAPGIALIPGIGVIFNAGIGIRYYF